MNLPKNFDDQMGRLNRSFLRANGTLAIDQELKIEIREVCHDLTEAELVKIVKTMIGERIWPVVSAFREQVAMINKTRMADETRAAAAAFQKMSFKEKILFQSDQELTAAMKNFLEPMRVSFEELTQIAEKHCPDRLEKYQELKKKLSVDVSPELRGELFNCFKSIVLKAQFERLKESTHLKNMHGSREI